MEVQSHSHSGHPSVRESSLDLSGLERKVEASQCAE